MNRITFQRVALFAIALAGVVGAALPAQGQKHITYARMAPLSRYLMDRNAEIALARSAAPPAISNGATILYLTPHGYVTAVKGTNGFTCMVGHGNWDSAFDDEQFWNPKARGPICYNPPASRSVLQYSILRTKLVLAGLSKQQMYARISAMVAKNELPTPEPGSMSYMMSKYQYINDYVGKWYPMLMFDVPKADDANGGASWGSNLTNSPVVSDTHKLWPEPEALFVVPVARWSDGTKGPPL
jgi:hypothetical protein